jgi:nitrate reductase NapD
MSEETIDPERRALLLGRFGKGVSPSAPEHHISSLVIHALPDAAEAVCTAVSALEGVEVHAREPSGKLVVTLETSHETQIVEHLNAIQAMRGVLSVALVFHHFEQTNMRG